MGDERICFWNWRESDMLLDKNLQKGTHSRMRKGKKKKTEKQKKEREGEREVIKIFFRYTRNRPRFHDDLDRIKFICKEFWTELFQKQVDKLRTNHKVNLFHFSSFSLFWFYFLIFFLRLFFRIVFLSHSLISILTQGTFVLHDNKFRWLSHFSSHGPWTRDKSHHYIFYPCGLIRGALKAIGITCVVSAEAKDLPACMFMQFLLLI